MCTHLNWILCVQCSWPMAIILAIRYVLLYLSNKFSICEIGYSGIRWDQRERERERASEKSIMKFYEISLYPPANNNIEMKKTFETSLFKLCSMVLWLAIWTIFSLVKLVLMILIKFQWSYGINCTLSKCTLHTLPFWAKLKVLLAHTHPFVHLKCSCMYENCIKYLRKHHKNRLKL